MSGYAVIWCYSYKIVFKIIKCHESQDSYIIITTIYFFMLEKGSVFSYFFPAEIRLFFQFV